jgi:hypothetical protein
MEKKTMIDVYITGSDGTNDGVAIVLHFPRRLSNSQLMKHVRKAIGVHVTGRTIHGMDPNKFELRVGVSGPEPSTWFIEIVDHEIYK